MIKLFLNSLKLIPDKFRSKIIFIQLLILANSFLEVISLLLIIPLIRISSNFELIHTSKYLKLIYDYFSFQNEKHFIILLSLILVFIFILSNFFILWSRYNIVKFSQIALATLTNLIFKNILSRDLNFFLSTSLSKITRILTEETSRLVSGVIFPYLNIFSRSILSISIIVVLLFQSFEITIVSFFVFTLLYFLIFNFFQKNVKKMGSDLHTLGTKRIELINNSYNSIRDIKVYDKSNFFKDIFDNISYSHANIYSKINIISISPRYLIDSILFSSGILFLIFLLVINDNNLVEIFPIMTLFALAAYRLIPSFQDIYNSLITIKNNSVSYDLIKNINDNLKYEETNIKKMKPLSFQDSILFKNIYFKYQSSDKYLFKDIDIKIPVNKKIAIIGKTGSGKSTILEIILGLQKPENFNLFIDNKNISPNEFDRLKLSITYVSQKVITFNDSLLNNITLGEKVKNMKNLLLVLKISKCNEFIKHLPKGINTIIGEKGMQLSGGQIQRLGIARALYFDRKILVLDEATNSLDKQTEMDILNSLFSIKNKTIIFVTHSLENIKKFDCVYRIENGKVNIINKTKL